LFFSVLLTVFACKKQLDSSPPDKNQNTEQLTNDVVIGKKLSNPFSLKKLREAKQILNKNKMRAYSSNVTQPNTTDTAKINLTDLYVRFLPKDTAQLVALGKITDLKLYGYPLDYVLIKEGDRYNDPSLPKGSISWVYSVVKPNFSFPNNIKYEIVDSLHKPTENEEPLEAQALALTNNLPSNVLAESIKNKAAMGTDTLKIPKALDKKTIMFFGSRKHNPSGTINVYNTSTKRYEPLRRMRVFVRYWFWEDGASTDDNGYFRIDARYSKEVGLYASFRSDIATIRKGVNEWMGLWVSEKIGNQKGENNVHYLGAWQDDRLWRKATVHNAVQHYDDFAFINGLVRPNDVNIWLTDDFMNSDEGITLMLKGKNVANYLYSNDNISFTNNDFLNYLSKAVTTAIDFLIVPDRIKPDIILGWGGFDKTENTYALVFHELAHYSHFYKAGGFPYWRGVAKATVNVGKNDKLYGLGTQATAGNLAVTEAWAHYIGYYLTDRVLGNTFYTNPLGDLENQKPRLTPDISGIGWIPYGLFYDIFDNTPIENIELYNGNRTQKIANSPDNISGISPAMLYQQLTGEVKSISVLKNKLLIAYPTNTIALNQIFAGYGY
jgi:hypothetical protein